MAISPASTRTQPAPSWSGIKLASARAPTLGGPAQSIYEGFAHLHRQTLQRDTTTLRTKLNSARRNRWRVSDASADPIYLARAEGLRLQVIDSVAG
jgi:hypothetical protein